jgi:hypothetical protein
MKKLFPVLLLAVLVVGGCYPSSPITISGQVPAIESFNASPASIKAGEPSSLSWTVSGATTVSIDQGIGNVALTGSRTVSPASTTVYTITGSNSSGSVTATTQVIVTGVAAPPLPLPSPSLPVINYFIINPTIVSFGSSVTLSWNVTNATAVTIDNGIGVVDISGSITIMPVASTVYTMTATNAHGSRMATASVGVADTYPPPE